MEEVAQERGEKRGAPIKAFKYLLICSRIPWVIGSPFVRGAGHNRCKILCGPEKVNRAIAVKSHTRRKWNGEGVTNTHPRNRGTPSTTGRREGRA